jgi:sporadic carbohydrate cluster protein (TIGR04323 family)
MKKLRGYIFSRNFMGERVPQHVQNLVIRDYCQKNGYQYLLSATEYAMEGCHLIFYQVLDELNSIHGIAMYSLFQLPQHKEERNSIYEAILNKNKTLHFSVEGISLIQEKDVQRIEDIWKVKQVLPFSYLFT